jgi:Cu2+-exporting ATPase
MTDTAATVACRHCGTPFEAESQGQEFCCAGCSFVHDLIASSGLERFYDLKGAERILPAGNAVLAKVDTAWAAPLQQEAEAKCQEGAMPQLKLDLQGVSCIGCVWLIDALFQQQPGAGRILVDASRGEAVLRWLSGQFHLPEFAEELAKFGYRLAPSTGGDNSASASGLRLGLAGGLALNAMAFTLPRYLGMAASFQFASLFEMVAAFSATMSLLLCGSYFIGRAWGALKAGRLHIDVPIAGGVLAA